MSLITNISIDTGDGTPTNYDIGVEAANVNGINGYTQKSTIAPTETTSTASHAYSEGDYFIKGNDFCTAIDDIAIGDTLTENTNYTVGQLVDSLGGDLSNYIQKSATEGLVMNDGTIDTSKHVHLKPTGTELTGEVQAKTWSGLSSFNGDYIWTDGDNIYYSYNSNQYVLDKSTSTWSTKTWNGLSSFNGGGVWTDGDNIYYSDGKTAQCVLDKSTSTWSAKTQNGTIYIYGGLIQTDGNNIYHSSQYVLDKSTSTWNDKTWTGLTSFDGQYIQTDGDNIYYSKSNNQYVLNKSTSTQNAKSQTGLTSFNGNCVQTDGDNIYYSYSTTQYVLNKSTSTWSAKSQTGLTDFYGNCVQTDGDNIYYSKSNNQYVFVSEAIYANGFVKSDGTIDTNTYLTAESMPFTMFKLTATLAAAATSVSITDSRLGADTFILGPNTSAGIRPTAVSFNDSTHTYTATFPAQQSAVTVAIVGLNFTS